ncbi:transporter substrate-binding domain-containing protein [Roseibium denhamense]|uniref:Amino acid ABC transporter substrate-binding protein, PAAT family n=1 Tax=Roseibium denhamense TaxID=76305 RepID=A0ABY1PJM5_9HYPH|nr:transporter substrate-binding domain-containing protein [Roseibium denhamense]MTI05867.1 transporter substrate-binding domain-containing protein [Roseibium denhamense]SMP35536.1 amino acid ABC transporter substrate-binding protein, PAAT family [Roseibium denhamense]
MKYLMRFVSAFCLLAILSVPARAEAIKLVTLEYPPYEYETETGADGIVVRILQEAFQKMGKDIEISVLPWKRALNMTQTGEADAIFTAYKTPERETFLDYSETVLMPQVLSVWAKKGSDIGFDGSIESLSNVSIGLVDGISYGTAVDDAVAAGTLKSLDYAPESSNNIKKLLGGRIDAVIMNKYGAMHHLKNQNGLDQVAEIEPEISSVPSYIAFSKANGLADLRDQLDGVLQEMIASGEYQSIIDAYFQE